MIRVHIAVSTPMERAGLDAVLRSHSDFELVSQEAAADVVITDTLANGGEESGPPIVYLSEDRSELLRGGVRVVLPRDATAAQIVAAVHAAAAGMVATLAEDAASLPERRAEKLIEPLTPRETQVLEMMAEGLSNKEIAGRLGISDHTAKFHVNSILTKLNASTRTEAVMRGIRSGLIMI